MRVILPGAANHLGWTTRLFCSGQGETFPGEGCGALLEIHAPDLFLQTIQVDRRSECVLAVECPQCGTPTAVGPVPETVHRIVMNVQKAPPRRNPANLG